MTRITDEAVEAALDVLFDHGHNGIKCYDPRSGLDATVRAALEAALPHLEGATPAIDRGALVKLIDGAQHYDTCDLALSPLTNQFGCSCLLADLRALISGAS